MCRCLHLVAFYNIIYSSPFSQLTAATAFNVNRVQLLNRRSLIATPSFKFGRSYILQIHRSPSLRQPHSYGHTSGESPTAAASKHPVNIKRSMASRKTASKKDDSSSITHAPEILFTNSTIDRTRTKLLTINTPLPRERDSLENPCIIYWMMRDVRVQDNWALLFAQSLAVQNEVPLSVVFTLPPPPEEKPSYNEEDEFRSPPNPADMSLTERHGTFLLDGLKVVEIELQNADVRFDVLLPQSRSHVGEAVHSHCTKSRYQALAVVCDMSPLRLPRLWCEKQAAPLLEQSKIPLYQVDAHNIVPVWIASPKREVGARTLRPKIHNVFGKYCTHFPEFKGNKHLRIGTPMSMQVWDRHTDFLTLDESIRQVPGIQGGHERAMHRFREFCTSDSQGLKNFDSLRNDPNFPLVCTNLSPYINHGHISFQRLAIDVRALKRHPNGTAAYIEEGVVRRELSDNFVYYTPDEYDSLDGAAEWARESLDLHSTDEREYLYTWKQLERGETHDDLWNAAQLQLLKDGCMHGFMRMYWAKKVLEWTKSPAYALATAQYLNDRYAYDGNDPNGFVGIGWSIMGIHDMGWKERPVFGKIRFMNYAGCKRKFKIDQFIARYQGAKENARKAASIKGVSGGSSVSGKKRKA